MLYEVLLKAHSLSLGVNVLLVMSVFKNLSQMYLFSVLVFCCIHVRASSFCGGQKSVRSSGPGIKDGCKPPSGCWELYQVLCKGNKSS